MIRGHQVSIGKIMLWVAVFALAFELALEIARLRTGTASAICMALMYLVLARKQVRLIFSRPPSAGSGLLSRRPGPPDPSR